MNNDLERSLGHSLWLSWSMRRRERGDFLEKWAKGYHQGSLHAVRSAVRCDVASWKGVGFWFRHYKTEDSNRYANRASNHA